MDIKAYQQFKQRIEAKQREADKARGAFEAAMTSIKKLYGADTLAKAKALLNEMQQDLSTAEAEYQEAYDKFIEEHPEFDSTTNR